MEVMWPRRTQLDEAVDMRNKPHDKPTCVFCKKSEDVQFAILNPRFQPFGTACVECEKELPEGTVVPDKE